MQLTKAHNFIKSYVFSGMSCLIPALFDMKTFQLGCTLITHSFCSNMETIPNAGSTTGFRKFSTGVINPFKIAARYPNMLHVLLSGSPVLAAGFYCSYN